MLIKNQGDYEQNQVKRWEIISRFPKNTARKPVTKVSWKLPRQFQNLVIPVDILQKYNYKIDYFIIARQNKSM